MAAPLPVRGHGRMPVSGPRRGGRAGGRQNRLRQYLGNGVALAPVAMKSAAERGAAGWSERESEGEKSPVLLSVLLLSRRRPQQWPSRVGTWSEKRVLMAAPHGVCQCKGQPHARNVCIGKTCLPWRSRRGHGRAARGTAQAACSFDREWDGGYPHGAVSEID